MRVPLSAVLLVYALPALVTLLLVGFVWRAEKASLSWIETTAVALALLIGFCALEGRWPWEFHSPWRRHYWIALALAVLALAGSFPSPKAVLLVLAAAGLLGLLHKYGFQLHVEWSRPQHAILLIALLVLATLSFLGQVKIAETLPAGWFLSHLGMLVTSAALYAFFAASSAKVAQWMTIVGIVSLTLFLLSLWRRDRFLSRGAVMCLTWLLLSGLLYSFYSTDGSPLTPLIALFLATLSGFLLNRCSKGSPRIIALVWTCVCILLALAAYLWMPADPVEEEEDYLDAYSFVAPQWEAEER